MPYSGGMSNQEMIPNRFAKFAAARRKVAWINEMLASGKTVAITNHLRSVRYNTKHIGQFKATKSGAYVQQGTKLVCIDHNKISAI